MYRNWKAICQIPDYQMMKALALLDLKSELGQMIIERLPEFFTSEEQAGPYPLSLMREAARDHGLRDGCAIGEQNIVSHGGVPEGIPVIKFTKGADRAVDDARPQLPNEIRPDATVGETVSWQGKDYVVLENDQGKEMSLAPAELVFIDC